MFNSIDLDNRIIPYKMLFEHELKEDLGIPMFNIDRESYQSDTTRLQTRIEAFLEMI